LPEFTVSWFSAREQADCYVVIDVFRASSFIVTALALGARTVIPAKSTREALLLRKEGDLLAGERKTRSIRGFDMDNSPSELFDRTDTVNGRTIIHRTSAGTKVIRSMEGKNVLIGSAMNAGAVRERIEQEDYRRVCFVCCGLEGREFALEDLYGVKCVTQDSTMKPENDFALLAGRVREKDVRICKGAGRLRANGYGNDMELCLRKDFFDVCPSMSDGKLTLDHAQRDHSGYPL
jgi:2-phosphosulfolactate phosphatase